MPLRLFSFLLSSSHSHHAHLVGTPSYAHPPALCADSQARAVQPASFFTLAPTPLMLSPSPTPLLLTPAHVSHTFTHLSQPLYHRTSISSTLLISNLILIGTSQ
ncbi:hypothetical protein EJ03DRAFT_322973 [Teratosphaeria nubilosa]|uniref:Uncharacterized protein n=1 Tax=Teratosphaeria nubilosa TaxID=161662 RepID=A0A6G1LN30_9PEZI|nr:hypothetical protein EJ03DRAFT_322973 [Teratosphaeria nubilosa]